MGGGAKMAARKYVTLCPKGRGGRGRSKDGIASSCLATPSRKGEKDGRKQTKGEKGGKGKSKGKSLGKLRLCVLFSFPENVRQETDRFEGYCEDERKRTLRLMEADPALLTEFLNTWPLGLFEAGERSMKWRNILLHSVWALKTAEFAAPLKGEDLVTAVYKYCCRPRSAISMEKE